MRRRAFLAAAGAATALAGCLGPADSTRGDPTRDSGGRSYPDSCHCCCVFDGDDGQLRVRESGFTPHRPRVVPGTSVLWQNDSGAPHTVTAVRFHDVAARWEFDVRVAPDETVARVFERAGVYEFFCREHGAAVGCGAVLVGGADLARQLPCERR